MQPPEPALWVIRDADSTMYFYGTIHLRKAGAPWGGPAAERALAEAKEVWTEVEIDPVRDAELQGVVGRMGYDTTRTLSSLMTRARAGQLKTTAQSIGVPMTALDAMKPWLASLTISIVPMVRAGYDPAAGVDHSIDRIARAAGKHMRWFETGEQQIQFMAGFADPLQLEMLYDSMDDIDKGMALMARMEAATLANVRAGDATSEREFGYRSEPADRPVGHAKGRPYRAGAGWFSFDLPVDPAARLAVVVTYLNELGLPPAVGAFDVVVEGTPIATFAPNGTATGFYLAEYAVPAALVQGKSRATVRFQAASSKGRIAPVFGVRIIRAGGV